MGTGTYTILAQTAADALGVPVERVTTKLGDSRLPRAPVAGGSQLANLMTAAVHKTALAARDELIVLGLTDPNSPLRDQANTLVIADGRIAPPSGSGITIAELMAATGRDVIEVTRDTLPSAERSSDERLKYFTTLGGMERGTDIPVSRHSFCAHFIEVRVDEDFGTVRVSRVVTALDAGRLYNPRLADSQFKGGIVMGIGMALLEEGIDRPAQRAHSQREPCGLSDRDKCGRARISRRYRSAFLTTMQPRWAARRWVSSRLSVLRQRSRMQFSTRPASASAAFRSLWKVCCEVIVLQARSRDVRSEQS